MRSIQRLWTKFQRTHSIHDLPRAAKPRLITAEMLNSIDIYLRNDVELKARKLVIKLGKDCGDLPDVSNSTIKRYG